MVVMLAQALDGVQGAEGGVKGGAEELESAPSHQGEFAVEVVGEAVETVEGLGFIMLRNILKLRFLFDNLLKLS